MPGLADDDVALYDAWARITIVEPAARALPCGCIAARSSPSAREIWRVMLIADGTRGPVIRGGTHVRRHPGQMVTLTRES